jgi:dihydrofolate reductase
VVVSHSVPDDIPDGSVYIFVDSVEAAFERAQKVAGNKNIGVSGANTPQQLITLGLIDEIFVHVVPVLFGSGVCFFEYANGEHVPLEIIETIETKEVIHLRFRVIK